MSSQKVLAIITANLVLIYFSSQILLEYLGLPKNYQRHSAPSQFERVNNPDLVYVNKKNATIKFKYDGNPRQYFHPNQVVTHTTNSLGFRGREFIHPKSASNSTSTNKKIRIMIVGDSFTFGEGVYNQDTYSAQLEAKLQGKLQDESLDFSVMNFGVGGYNAQQQSALIKTYAKTFEPNILVLAPTLNDVEPKLFWPLGSKSMKRRDRESKIFEGQPLSTQTPNYLKWSRLLEFFWQHYEAQQISQQTEDYYHQLYTKQNQHLPQNLSAWQEIDHFSANKNLPLVVMIFPVLHQLNDYPFAQQHQQVRRQFQHGQVIDLTDKLNQYQAQELWVHPTDQHPSEIVHRIAAEELMSVILPLVKTHY